MRNYASKSNKRMTRFRTPSSFKARFSEAIKRLKLSPPWHPPERGKKSPEGNTNV